MTLTQILNEISQIKCPSCNTDLWSYLADQDDEVDE